MAIFGKRKIKTGEDGGINPTAYCPSAQNGVCCVKVLGAGCKACKTMFENAKTAAAALGLDIEVEYITDMRVVARYGVMSMPALVINERVVSMGKTLKAAEIETMLKEV